MSVRGLHPNIPSSPKSNGFVSHEGGNAAASTCVCVCVTRGQAIQSSSSVVVPSKDDGDGGGGDDDDVGPSVGGLLHCSSRPSSSCVVGFSRLTFAGAAAVADIPTEDC